MSSDAAPDQLAGNVYAPLPDWSALSVTGPDAATFLQNFCTNDVAGLKPGEACEAFFTEVKAHVLAYAIVARSDHGFLCVLSSDRAAQLAAHLDRYLIREDVELGVIDEPLTLLGAGYADTDAPAAAAAGWGAGCRVAIGSIAIDDQATRLSTDQLDWLRITLGVPRDGIDVDERNLPQEVDRNEQAISFTKGCFLGQEPVARIDALGRVNWLLRGVSVTGGPAAAGDELFADGVEKSVGRITSSATAGDRVIALAYLRREHAAAENRLTINGAAATVHSLPMSAD